MGRDPLGYQVSGPQVLLERLLLVLYAYGTGAGVRAVAVGEHDHSEHDLLRAPLAPDRRAGEALAIQIANATFAARQRSIWGEDSSAVSSDSTHFGRGTRTSSPNGIPATVAVAC